MLIKIGWRDKKSRETFETEIEVNNLISIPRIGEDIMFLLSKEAALSLFDATAFGKAHGVGVVSRIAHNFKESNAILDVWLEDIRLYE